MSVRMFVQVSATRCLTYVMQLEYVLAIESNVLA